MTFNRMRVQVPRIDLKIVVRAAHHRRLYHTASGKMIEKVAGRNGTINYVRNRATREALRLGYLELLPTGMYRPTEAGRAEFGFAGDPQSATFTGALREDDHEVGAETWR